MPYMTISVNELISCIVLLGQRDKAGQKEGERVDLNLYTVDWKCKSQLSNQWTFVLTLQS